MPSRLRSFTFLRCSLLLATLTLFGVPLGALARQDATPASASAGGTLTAAFDVGPGGCVECFNPLQATAGFTWLEKYYSKLIQYDIDFTQLQGDLAETWEASADGTEYTLHLREGVTWHDGETFTSADVKFSIDLVKNPDSASYLGAKFTAVSAVATPDDLTVVITLSEPNAAFPDSLTFLAMLPEHALASIPAAELASSDWWSTSPIGTGPFMWSQNAPGEFVELVAFDDYWRGRPQLDRLINRYYPEAGSAVIALRSGDIDFTFLAPDEARALGGEAEFQILQGPSQVTNYLTFNHTDPRFEDIRVRQAFMYAIDRQLIIDELYQGAATLSPCIYQNPDYQPADANAYAYDPEMARSLLAEAGWTGESIEVITYYSDQLSTDVLVTIQQLLADVGIEITIRAMDGPTYTEITADPTQWTLSFAGLLNGPDPDAASIYFTSTSLPPTGGNRAYVNIPEIDPLFPQGRAEVDLTARATIYQQICGIMNEELPYAWMWVADRFGGVSLSVNNFAWTPAPAGGRYYDAVETWTVSE